MNGKTADMVKNAAEMVEDMTDDQVMSQTIIFCFILFIYTGPWNIYHCILYFVFICTILLFHLKLLIGSLYTLLFVLS